MGRLLLLLILENSPACHPPSSSSKTNKSYCVLALMRRAQSFQVAPLSTARKRAGSRSLSSARSSAECFVQIFNDQAQILLGMSADWSTTLACAEEGGG